MKHANKKPKKHATRATKLDAPIPYTPSEVPPPSTQPSGRAPESGTLPTVNAVRYVPVDANGVTSEVVEELANLEQELMVVCLALQANERISDAKDERDALIGTIDRIARRMSVAREKLAEIEHFNVRIPGAA